MFSYRIDGDLELRLPKEHHAEEAHALVTENFTYLKEWLPWVRDDYSLESTRTYIRWNLRQFSENKGYAVNIVYQNRIAGSVGYNSINWENRQTEIGYWLGASFQGKGLIGKACRVLIDHAFNELKLNRVAISCAVENLKSRAIPERLGFTQEGILRQAEWVHNHFNDLVLYAMLKSEWEAANKL